MAGRSSFLGMRPVVTLGIPFFTLLFFLLYWFVLCPIIWDHSAKTTQANHHWDSPWLYWYWMVAAAVWTICVFIAVYCWKREDQPSGESDVGSSEHLLSSQTDKKSSYKTPVPFNVTPIPVQPKGEKEGIAPFQRPVAGIDISHVHLQPSTLRSMPTSRPSTDFLWDDENVPWLAGNADTAVIPEDVAMEGLPLGDCEIDFEIYSPKSRNSPALEDEDQSQDLDFLGIENRTEFYQITPTGSPIHSSSSEDEELTSPLENQPVLETENPTHITKRFDETK